MKKIYGNEYLLSTLGSMVRRDKAAHTVLFYGEKGSGRKLMAKYYTTLLMCESPEDGRPCGKCRGCQTTGRLTNPDVTYVPSSGKLGGYSVETARSVISDAFVMPNNSSGRKVYIFTDCHSVDPRTQNTLLKLIEEPPDHAYFIFTSESKSDFLPTVISRCACFGTSLCTEQEAAAALAEAGHSEEDIKRAVSCFHGNIGMCESYIVNEQLRKRVDLTKSLADSIIRKDEYTLNALFFSASRERNEVREVLSMLGKLVRDAAVLARAPESADIGCSRRDALRLSRGITAYQAARINVHVEKAWRAIESNVSIPLVLSALCADIMNTI